MDPSLDKIFSDKSTKHILQQRSMAQTTMVPNYRCVLINYYKNGHCL